MSVNPRLPNLENSVDKLDELRRKEKELQEKVYQRMGQRDSETRRLLSELSEVQQEISRLEKQDK